MYIDIELKDQLRERGTQVHHSDGFTDAIVGAWRVKNQGGKEGMG